MKLDDRRDRIMDLLIENGSVELDWLAEHFTVSRMTIHHALDGAGVLRKVRGGATIEGSSRFESDFRHRARKAAGEKARIVARALELVEPGQTVILDDSSTATAAIERLSDRRPLAVITNNLEAITRLPGTAGLTLIALGGSYSTTFNGFFGLLAEEALGGLRADVALISTSAVSGGVAYHQDQSVVATKRRMIAAARRRYLLVDHAKFGRTALHHMSGLGAFDAVITGRPPGGGGGDRRGGRRDRGRRQGAGGMRRVWVGTGWKMTKTLPEALAYADALAAMPPTAPGVQRFVVPPFTAVREVKARLAGTDVMVGAQTMHWEDAGAWTGEISAPMLVDCGLDMVELGHSERRRHFGETDTTVALKAAAAVRHGLLPLVCVGESAADREAGRADAVLAAQVAGALARLAEPASVLFAYEPVWAIGDGGEPAAADYAAARHAGVKRAATAQLGAAPPCLYGGSVNAGNAAALIAEPGIDGLFIGRAAWDVAGYLDILARCTQVMRETSKGETP